MVLSNSINFGEMIPFISDQDQLGPSSPGERFGPFIEVHETVHTSIECLRRETATAVSKCSQEPQTDQFRWDGMWITSHSPTDILKYRGRFTGSNVSSYIAFGAN